MTRTNRRNSKRRNTKHLNSKRRNTKRRKKNRKKKLRGGMDAAPAPAPPQMTEVPVRKKMTLRGIADAIKDELGLDESLPIKDVDTAAKEQWGFKLPAGTLKARLNAIATECDIWTGSNMVGLLLVGLSDYTCNYIKEGGNIILILSPPAPNAGIEAGKLESFFRKDHIYDNLVHIDGILINESYRGLGLCKLIIHNLIKYIEEKHHEIKMFSLNNYGGEFSFKCYRDIFKHNNYTVFQRLGGVENEIKKYEDMVGPKMYFRKK